MMTFVSRKIEAANQMVWLQTRSCSAPTPGFSPGAQTRRPAEPGGAAASCCPPAASGPARGAPSWKQKSSQLTMCDRDGQRSSRTQTREFKYTNSHIATTTKGKDKGQKHFNSNRWMVGYVFKSVKYSSTGLPCLPT